MSPLPYGEDVDWLKNVLVAGRAMVETKGRSYVVIEPRVVGTETAFPLLAERHRRAWRMFRIERFLKVRRLQANAGERT